MLCNNIDSAYSTTLWNLARNIARGHVGVHSGLDVGHTSPLPLRDPLILAGCGQDGNIAFLAYDRTTCVVSLGFRGWRASQSFETAIKYSWESR